jgi:hypothetical protein
VQEERQLAGGEALRFGSAGGDDDPNGRSSSLGDLHRGRERGDEGGDENDGQDRRGTEEGRRDLHGGILA